MVATADAKRRAALIVRRLKAAYPDARCALNYKTPLQLLVATILSAQCTDTRVNIVTKDLFQKYPDAKAFAAARLPQLERAIQSTGFFRNKAKNIKRCCSELMESHGGQIPKQIDILVQLPGVGRKTANVVLGTAFGIPTGVVVDTHVGRVSQRLGLTRHKDPVKIERDLMDQLSRSEWVEFAHRMIHHGRQVCLARKPKCDVCTLADICPRIGVANRS
ncbi:MAG TPA: endonuclease III [Pirellulales bacterium]|nr:endonuclease III [Pirellulales bacterium]